MRDVEGIIGRLDELGSSQDRVTIEDVSTTLGEGGLGSALLALGFLALSPVGDIPGAPTIMSVFILGVGLQIAIGRDQAWIPGPVARRSFKGRHLHRMARFFRPVARFLGKFIRPRMTFLTTGWYRKAIAIFCSALALSLPPLEFVPFGATVPSSAITGFALALVTHDGLLAIVCSALTIAGLYLIATAM